MQMLLHAKLSKRTYNNNKAFLEAKAQNRKFETRNKTNIQEERTDEH
jgi:hypothetical protein